MAGELGQINHFLIRPVYYLMGGFFFFFSRTVTLCVAHINQDELVSPFSPLVSQGFRGRVKVKEEICSHCFWLRAMANCSTPCGEPVPGPFSKSQLGTLGCFMTDETSAGPQGHAWGMRPW